MGTYHYIITGISKLLINSLLINVNIFVFQQENSAHEGHQQQEQGSDNDN